MPQFWRALTPQRLIDKLWLGLAAKIFPVGAAIPWFTDIAPNGFAIMKNQVFDKIANPQCALIWPDGIIPDMRGCGVIGKEDGETIGVFEEGQVKEHGHEGSSVGSTNLGTKTTNTDTHYHTYQKMRAAQSNQHGHNPWTTYGTETKNTSSDSHNHTVVIGSHVHTIMIALFGALKNTINHRKVNWIVRLA
ncbi:phage tail protein [Aliivibrio logei]|uniref:Phage tail protein n=1 Tax=Aliivibrio logei TaxID=688 RepID=A0A1B9P2D9_ALILO|nr:phage tail protein [Aliivibrio logei]